MYLTNYLLKVYKTDQQMENNNKKYLLIAWTIWMRLYLLSTGPAMLLIQFIPAKQDLKIVSFIHVVLLVILGINEYLIAKKKVKFNANFYAILVISISFTVNVK